MIEGKQSTIYDFFDILHDVESRFGITHQQLYRYHDVVGVEDGVEYKNLWHKLLDTLPEEFRNNSYVVFYSHKNNSFEHSAPWTQEFLKLFWDTIDSLAKQSDPNYHETEGGAIIAHVSW